MSLLLGIDVGTSSTKALVLRAERAARGVLGGGVGGVGGVGDGVKVIAAASASHPLHQPRAGWSEQEPRDWWDSTVRAVREVLDLAQAAGEHGAGERVVGVGLSGQMHGSVFLDAKAIEAARSGGRCEAVRPALLWNDQRTASQCAQIENALGGRAALVEIAGNAALTGFTLPKILWLREHEPEAFARVAMIVNPKDYVRLRMTGIAATDVGDASGTLLLDVRSRAWSPRVCHAVGLDPAMLPPVLESAAPAGMLHARAAKELGLRAGVVVAAGSGDNMMGAVGAGVVEEGLAVATIGTSGVIYAHTGAARPDLAGPGTIGRTHAMCAADGTASEIGGWCITGCTLSAGYSLQWLHDTIAPGETYDTLLAEAAQIKPGCEGLVFLPYLTGERCPHPDPLARGAFVGLTGRHTRGHLVRAVLEGVTFAMGEILEIQRGLGGNPRAIRLGGGGAKSELWRQMQADVYNVPVALTNTEEGPALGAAIVGGVAAGVWPSVRGACADVIRETRLIEPANSEAYANARRVFGRLYGDLRSSFAGLAEV